MYCGEMECKNLSLAWNLGLHPSTLAHLSSSSSNFPKVGTYRTIEPPGGLLLVFDCYNMLSVCNMER
jgi:hypothetical protein